MTETRQEPIVLRADITRHELVALKIEALHAGMTVQQFLAHLIRERLAT